MPGTAVATDVEGARRESRRLEIRAHTVVVEVLEQGVVGGEGAGPEPAVGSSASS